MLTIDINRLQQAIKYLVDHPGTGPDIITDAVRMVSNDPNLVLTREQRHQCKFVLYSTLYNSEPYSIINILKNKIEKK